MKQNGNLTGSNIISNLLLNEIKINCQNPLILPRGEDCVTEEQRNTEVQWLCKQGKQLDLGLDTVGAAISIFDRVLTQTCVRSKYANCVAVTSLYIAIKLFEEGLDSIGIEDILNDFDVEYSINEVLRMERSILAKLKWHLISPTVERFIFVMLSQLGSSITVESIALREKVEDLFSCWNLMSKFRPSLLALSLISVVMNPDEDGLESLKLCARLMKTFEIDQKELRSCSSFLEDLFYGESDKEN
uniref:Cyclin-like domain-containing protein n=1 Tax=Panagrolaimus superbus TaxID=310955 RepID=A0A914YXH6_9BILA